MTRYGILGLGRVGSLLATTLVANGHDVSWTDPSIETAPPNAGQRSTLDAIRTCQVVVECVDECRDTKIAVLEELAGTSAAVLTTTSSFRVADLASLSGIGGRLAGFHFLPSYGGNLAEITSLASDSDVGVSARELAKELNSGWIEVADTPGRISRRLLVPFVENVLHAVDLNIAAPEAIDQVVELGLGHSVGPLRRLATAGLDDHRATAKALLDLLPVRTTGTATSEKGTR